jgi:hypothetical protein
MHFYSCTKHKPRKLSRSFPQTLSSLSQREAIVDALYRATIASDNHDSALFNSALAEEDVSMEIYDDNKRVLQGLSLIRTHVLNKVGPMDTTHNISMVYISYQNPAEVDTTA